MDKPDYFFLSAKEEAAMKVLWASEKALSATQIAEKIPNRSWSASSIQNILRSLEKKNAIRVESIAKIGKSYGRFFVPTISANEYATMQFSRYYQDSKKDCFSMINSLLGNTNTKKEEAVEVLQALLKEYETDKKSDQN